MFFFYYTHANSENCRFRILVNMIVKKYYLII